MKEKEIQTLLSKIRPTFQSGVQGRESAVLIPLVCRDGQWEILFEVRSAHLNTQPGEICFPGGGISDGETPKEAAIRETCEELKLKASQIEILGPSDGSVSPRGTLIWTYVGVLHDYEDTFSKEEVAEIFTVPLEELAKLEPIIGKVHQKTIQEEGFPVHLFPNKKDYAWAEPVKEVLFYPWKNRVIWGVTARILHAFLKRLS